MPKSESQRKSAFAEIDRRKKGKKRGAFASMSSEELREYAHQPLKKKKKGNMAERKDYA